MATAIAFDPSSAKPVGFDPSTAKPLAEAVREKINSGPVATSEAFGRGLLSTALATPRSLEDLVNPWVRGIGQLVGAGKYVGPGSLFDPARNAMPDTGRLENILPGKSLGEAHPVAQKIGELAPLVMPAKMALGEASAAIKAVGTGVRALSDAVAEASPSLGRFLPGATNRVAGNSLTNLAGEASSKDKIGEDIISHIKPPGYEALSKLRKAEFDKVWSQDLGDYQRKVAFAKIYNKPEYAALKKIEDNPLVSIENTGEFSDVTKMNPTRFVNNSFRTPKDFRDLKALVGGDQEKAEGIARQVAGNELSGILKDFQATSAPEINPIKTTSGDLAKRLGVWRNKWDERLGSEAPETKKLIDHYVDNIIHLSKQQRAAKLSGYAALALGLSKVSSHFIPNTWLRGMTGGSE